MIPYLIILAIVLIMAIIAKVNSDKMDKKYFDYQMSRIVKTKILDSGSDGTKAGGVGRAVVGDIIAGPVGAVVGATTAGHKNQGFTVFKVWYDNGDIEVEKIAHSDSKYMEYLKLLDE